jgi:hypothetical protein
MDVPNTIQATEISGATASNAVCFLSHVSSNAAGWRCEAILSNGQWYGENLNSTQCAVSCLTWVANP